MKSMSVAGALCAALLALASPSQASVVDTFTVNPNPINAGASSLLDLNLSLLADPGYFNAQFIGGTVTLYSGIGPSATFGITPGLNPQDFQQSFAYPTAGNFTTSFSISASYSEQYQYLQQTGQYWVSTGGYYVDCGFFCSYFVPTGYWQAIYSVFTGTSYSNFYDEGTRSLVANALADPSPDIASTPLPAALPLFAGGLGLIGLLARRRKQRHAAALH